MSKVLSIILILICPVLVWGQVESNVRNIRISTRQDTIVLDTLSIAPNSVQVSDIDSNYYYIDYPSAKWVWLQKPSQDSVDVQFRVWPVNIAKSYSHKTSSVFMPDMYGKVNPFKYQGTPPKAQFSTGKLDKSGSISRGVLFGNNQNLGINSNLNLQLSGELTEKIKIKAVISDDNIPVQPDGNTQLLQDFDQVYIQLYNDDWKLTAGDFRIQKPKSYFMKFDKRLRGGGIDARFNLKENVENYLSVNAALSRGKFSRNIIQGEEGNQGPYRLTGAENESFITVLSGTEVVYIDGQKMTRGQENDYVIDYNKAEIVFTAKRPINRDKRIVVEFQYSAQAYSRSLIQVSDYVKMKKLNLNFNLYSEQDSKNQPLLQDLTNDNIELLESIGDDIDQAIVPSARQVEFSNDRVLYKREIHPVTGDSIYIFSTNPDSAIYQLSFSNVGVGNGDYIEIPSTANGRVFEYVAPIGGVRQGSYLPVILLITPKKRQMFTVGGDYQLSPYTKVVFEGAVTQRDLNSFSSIGNQNNVGGGVWMGIERRKQITNDTVAPWFMVLKVNYENRTDNFEEIQRYRSVEFDRDWNVRGQTLTGMQHVPSAEVGWIKKGLGQLGYQFKSFISGDAYQGFRHQLFSNIDNKKYTAKVTGSLLNSSGDLGNSNFNRHKALLQKKYEKINIGFRDDFEYNLRKAPSSDTLANTSYSFWEWEAFIANGDSTKNKFKLAYINRINDNVKNGQLQRSTFAQSVEGKLGLVSNPKAQLQLSSMYRVLEVKDTTLYMGNPEQTLTNRIDYTVRMLKGVVTLSSFYELGSGLTEEQAFVYVEVPAGTGVYTWVDYNGNGIAEQNEFEIAKFQDQANYIRVLTQTNNFEKVYRTQFNQTVFLRPGVTWKNKKGIRKVLSKFSNQFAYRVDRKTDDNSLNNWVDPFATSIADSNIRTLNSSLRNTVYLNRANKLWSIDYTYQDVSTKVLQTNGLLGTEDDFHLVNFRYNMSRIYQINLEAKQGIKRSGAQFYSNRNYQINYTSFKPIITYLQGSGVKIILSYEQSNKRNLVELGGETNLSEKYSAELNVRKVGRGSLIISGSYLINDYQGNVNSPIAFQMLDGLQPGKNGLWEVKYQRTIAKYLQLNLSYMGRVSENNPVIHTGNVQVRAFF
ncbi:hypothetical protein KFE94_05035 [bacterium SCSIO 12643]|nr:hypothetical protein KFE94_05035 [bacterium SCSIO 12643]